MKSSLNGFFYYGIDSLYIYLVIPAVLFAMWSQIRIKSAFSKYSSYRTNISGAEAARRVLEFNGVTGVRIERVSGNLTDHYDPRINVIKLSDSVYDTCSIAAVGVAAHEAGHAVQYAKSYFPIKARSFILPVCNLGSRLSLPLLIIGLISNFYFLVELGIIFFIVTFLFQVLTLPIEFNASKRALDSISQNYILPNESDVKGARKVLSAAAMTYVTAALVSLTQLIRLLAITRRK